MKRAIFMTLTILFCCTSQLLAKPVEVLVFPTGAIVTEDSTLAVSDGTMTLMLPEVADPASLQIGLSSGEAKIGAIQYQSMRAAGGDYQDLIDRIETVKDQRQAVVDALQAKKMAIDLLLKAQTSQFQAAEEIEKLSRLVSDQAEALYNQQSRLKKEEQALDKTLSDLERQLSAATSRKKRNWAVSVDIKGAAKTEKVRYSYRVRNAGWVSLYTLDARPGDENIRWDWNAEIRQSTAVDWSDVTLRLATAEPVFTLSPPPLAPWIIREVRYLPAPAPMAAKRAVTMLAESNDMALDSEEASVAAAPVRKTGTLFDIYDLGRQTIQAGEKYQLGIDKGAWPARFDYLARPLESPQAFLSAALTSDELLPMPSGRASILVEGVFVGSRDFALLEKEIELPFGNDPQIQIQVTPSRQADESRLFGKSRTQIWIWKLDVSNNKNVEVKLRIEDSLPRLEDKRIKLVERWLDQGAEEEGRARWLLDLQAGASKSVEYGYKISYPADMQIDLGR